jgi:Protein of unknown function (DUF3618)
VGQDPGEIREEIEATRDRMSETADALAYKVNVPARTKEKVAARKDALLTKVRDVAPTNRQEAAEQLAVGKQLLVGKAREVAKNPRQAGRQSLETTKRATAAARRNPRVVAIAGGLVAVLGLAAYRRTRRSAPAPAMSRKPTGERRLEPVFDVRGVGSSRVAGT